MSARGDGKKRSVLEFRLRRAPPRSATRAPRGDPAAAAAAVGRDLARAVVGPGPVPADGPPVGAADGRHGLTRTEKHTSHVTTHLRFLSLFASPHS